MKQEAKSTAKECVDRSSKKLGKMDCYAVSDIGQKRRVNEDQFLVADLVRKAQVQLSSLDVHQCDEVTGEAKGKFLLVADGMGGHAAGQRASKLAAEHALRFVTDHLPWPSDKTLENRDGVLKTLDAAFQHCQRQVSSEAAWNPRHRGMGTTLTAAYLDWPSLYVAHVGDSRCYLCRDGKLIQLTRDHTYAQALVDEGQMLPDEARNSRFTHALWNVVGGNDTSVEPDVEVYELQIGDTLLMCSDGLTNHVNDELLAEILSNSTSSRTASESLVRIANEFGGNDNITAIVARFIDAAAFDKLELTGNVDESAFPFESDFSLSDSTIRYIHDGH